MTIGTIFSRIMSMVTSTCIVMIRFCISGMTNFTNTIVSSIAVRKGICTSVSSKNYRFISTIWCNDGTINHVNIV